MSAAAARRRPALSEVFFREVLPDPRGLLGFAIVAAVLSCHLLLAPDHRGYLFGNLLRGLPSVLSGPYLETVLEALAQAFLLVGPAIAFYAALRHLHRQGDSLLPFITAGLGGVLMVLTGVGLLVTLA